MKEEALKLADEWDWMTEEKLAKWGDDAQAMIRRLVEELDKQGEPVAWTAESEFNRIVEEATTPQTKPLSDEELLNMWWDVEDDEALIKFARAIEERHGIK